MNKRISIFTITAVVSAGVALGYTYAQTPPAKPQNQPAQTGEEDEGGEVTIKIADAPAPVKAAIAKLTPEKGIKRIIKETDEGITVYEVEYETDGTAHSADLSEAGDVVAMEAQLKVDALPQAVAKAVAKAFPKSTIKSAESVQEFYYELSVTVDGKPQHVKVNANGEIQSKKHEQDNDGDKD